MTELDFYFDFGSPTAFLANSRLRQLQQEYDFKIHYKPVLLGGIFKATGNSSPVMVAAKGEYMLKHDLPRYAQKYSVALKFNPHFPINTLQLMRAATGLLDKSNFDSFINTIFKAIWIDGLNMGDEMVLQKVLSDSNFNSHDIFKLASTDSVKEILIANTDSAVKRGLFGVPTIFINGEMFFGQDRLDFVEEILKSC
jgi:2-hydroxychromene-2-carboxylate isomerase|tara:strand:+ start:723 stop:1313 length:591 start_codon:yes stop_codon:yes gene_type:complete